MFNVNTCVCIIVGCVVFDVVVIHVSECYAMYWCTCCVVLVLLTMITCIVVCVLVDVHCVCDVMWCVGGTIVECCIHVVVDIMLMMYM